MWVDGHPEIGKETLPRKKIFGFYIQGFNLQGQILKKTAHRLNSQYVRYIDRNGVSF